MVRGEIPDEEEVDVIEEAIKSNVDVVEKELGRTPQRWNTMKDMRKALGLPLGNDGIGEFLKFWDSLNQEQRMQLRRGDLSNINEWEFLPSTGNKES